MSARDVIAQVPCGLKYLDQTMNWKQGVIGSKDADAILAALDAAGYAVVPKEPTADMLVEGNLVIARNRLFATDIYKAMLTAAKETTT